MRHILILFCCIISLNLYAQEKTAQDLVEEGVVLQDEGQYQAALAKYNEALKIDANHVPALYEASISSMYLQQYEKSIEFSNRILRSDLQDKSQVYVNKGSAEEMLGRYEQAIQTYKEGIEKYPNEYLIYFNLAVTYFKGDDVKNAEKQLYKALRINPEHASSNLILAYAMYYQDKKTQPMLALYYYLMLEPTGERAKEAYQILNKIATSGAKKEDDNKIQITLNRDNGIDTQFSSTDLLVSLLSAYTMTADSLKANPFDQFKERTEMFFSTLTAQKKEHHYTGFWWDFYVNFYASLMDAGQLETFCYYISQSDEKTDAMLWVKQHPEKMEAFTNWFRAYTSNNPFVEENESLLRLKH